MNEQEKIDLELAEGKVKAAMLKEAFLHDLKELLKKHGATITADFDGYCGRGETVRTTVEFDDYNKKDIDLGNYFTADD